MGIQKNTTTESFVKYAILLPIIFFSFSLFRNISKMYQAKNSITDANIALDNLDKENKKLAEKIEFVKSQDFIELQARDKLGLAKEGEIVVVLPEEDVLRALSPRIESKIENLIPDPNWKQWLKLFL